MSDRETFIDECFELTDDERVFDQDTGEQRPDMHLRVLTVSWSKNIQVLIDKFERPDIEAIADGIVDVLLQNGYGYTDVHAVLALAGAGALPRRILQEHPGPATQESLVTALTSVAMFHQLAADVVEEGPGQPEVEISEEVLDTFIRGMVEAGFTQIAPGIWAGNPNEQKR